MENELLKKLADRGCKVAETLEETYMGREDFYLKIIARLPNTTCLDRMEAALAAADAAAFFAASHELKGLYGTLGLTPLYDACCEMVEIARVGSLEGVPEKFAALKPRHAEFCALVVG